MGLLSCWLNFSLIKLGRVDFLIRAMAKKIEFEKIKLKVNRTESKQIGRRSYITRSFK